MIGLKDDSIIEYDGTAMHLEEVLHQKSFKEDYRMSYQAWENLRSILDKYLQRKKQYCRDSEPIYTEIMMGIGMRYLSGGMIRDSRRIYNVDRSEAYRCLRQFIDDVLSTPELEIKMPENWEKIRQGIENVSSNGIMQGCLGALDGYFQPTICPSKSHAKKINFLLLWPLRKLWIKLPSCLLCSTSISSLWSDCSWINKLCCSISPFAQS